MRNFFKIPVLAYLLLASPALAHEAMDVAPTTVHLTQGEAGLFFITNHGTQTVHVQVEAQDWSQENGTDKLSMSDTLFASPPLVEIGPGARQTVRLMALAGESGKESVHRLVVSQLPDSSLDANAAVRVLLQFSVPVFVGPQPKNPPTLSWDASRTAGGLDLAVRNDGDFTAKCVKVALSTDGHALPFDPGPVFYVLPHASRHFTALGLGTVSSLRLTGHDQRSDSDFSADLTPHN